ncbi:MAG: VWA domain-containing protein [Acidobacteria bacterium]|nr:VWA domain-containing protein [Acidobacteriota bacterium]
MRFILAMILAALASSSGYLAGQSTAPTPAASPAPAGNLRVPAGEKLLLELETSLHTRTTKKGDPVAFRTTRDTRADGRIAIPRGSVVRGTVTNAKRPGRLFGRAELQLRLDDVLLVDGTRLDLDATIVRVGVMQLVQGKSDDPKVEGDKGSGADAGAVLSGGVQGATIGVIAAGGKGAMYGGAIGAGVGLAGILLRRGPDIDLPRSTLFEAHFDQPFEIAADQAQRAAELARAEVPPPGELRVADREGIPQLPGRERPRLSRRDAEPPETVRIETAPPAGPDPAPAAAPPPATEPVAEDPNSFKLSVNVQLVQVDTLVRDRTGRPMDNLRREDFLLLEDGTGQGIAAFSRDELPLAVALVIDRSGSVQPYMNDIRRAAYRALLQLKPGDEVCLFSFAGEVERLEGLTTDRQRIADLISTIRAGGGTNIVDAAHDAVSYLGMVAPDRRRAVILISDNQATTRPRAGEGQTIRLALETETVIYSVKTRGETTPATLRLPNLVIGAGSVKKITGETGGEIIEVGSAGSLDAALATAVARLKLRYTLGYYPANASPGTYRRIEVRLADHFGRPGTDYSIHSRTGYYYPGPKTAVQPQP